MKLDGNEYPVKQIGDKSSIQLSKSWREEEKQRIAMGLFFNEDVLKQLHASENHSEDTDIVDYQQFRQQFMM